MTIAQELKAIVGQVNKLERENARLTKQVQKLEAKVGGAKAEKPARAAKAEKPAKVVKKAVKAPAKKAPKAAKVAKKAAPKAKKQEADEFTL